jgi:predicted transporter
MSLSLILLALGLLTVHNWDVKKFDSGKVFFISVHIMVNKINCT